MMKREPLRTWVTIVVLWSLGASCSVLASPVDAERQWIRIAMTQEPPNLNSIRSTDLVSFFLMTL